MGAELHLSVIEGTRKGEEISLPGEHPSIFGRSHTADYKFNEKDVSGKHAEFFLGNGCFVLRNLSRYITRVNGHAMAVGSEQVLAVGDKIQMGQSVTLNVKEIELPSAAEMPTQAQLDAATGATRWMPESLTNATVALRTDTHSPAEPQKTAGNNGLTNATVAPEFLSPSTTEEHSPTPNKPFVQKQPVADVATETVAVPSGQRATWMPSIKPSSPESKRIIQAPVQNPPSADADSGLFVTNLTVGPESETATGDENTGGETKAMVTRAGSMEEIFAIKAKLEYRNKVKRWLFAVALILFAAFLAGVWVLTETRKETKTMSYPLGSDGKQDMGQFAILGNERKLLEVDFPNDPRMVKTVSPDTNSVSVSTFMGLDRDVPFNLRLETIKRPDELELSLSVSFSAWMEHQAEASRGFIFERIWEMRFFEDVYPGSCQIATEYGIPFFSAEYRRPWQEKKQFWKGIVIYFRSADTVYISQREIPESAWERGKMRLLSDPNLAIYHTFSENYWGSPGKERMVSQWSDEQLLEKIDAQLRPERASAWKEVSVWVDTFLSRNWENPEKREQGWARFQSLRDYKQKFYNGQYFALSTVKANDKESRRVESLIQGVKAIFCNPEERYYYLVNNREVW